MVTRRNAIEAGIGAGLGLLLPGGAAVAARPVRVRPARLSHPAGSPAFVPVGEYQTKATSQGYLEEEWFASGTDDRGRPYETQFFVRRPADPAKFSGTVLVESLHAHRIAPIYLYSSPWILRSGHAWVCVTSQKVPLDAHVKPANPERYAGLHIETDPAPSGAPTNLTQSPMNSTPAARAAYWAEVRRYNQASNAILAQCAAAIRAQSGPFAELKVRHVLLVGHSQTGFVTTNFVREAHASHRLANGAPVFDGYFPAGFPSRPFGPRDVPLLQVVCDGDVFDGEFGFEPGAEGRKYRRPDSDAPSDRYRLYELASMPHMGTRNPPFNDPKMWQTDPGAGKPPLTATMNSMPHHELFDMALDHLVAWVTAGRVPPRDDRIALAPDGRYFAKDEHGNSLGGVRCAQIDVPRATYHPDPLNPDGSSRWGTVGTETAFDAAKMARLYGTPANYRARFEARLQELAGQGWLLAADIEKMRQEAQAQVW